MPLTLDYQRGLRKLSNVSPEIRAVPQTDALASAFGRASTQQRLSDADTGLRIRSMEESVRQNRLDTRAANKDSLLALGVTGVNTGMQLAVNRERTLAQQEAEKRAEQEKLYHQALDEIYDSYKERFMKEVLGGMP